jgi:cytoskeletal protein RodZ
MGIIVGGAWLYNKRVRQSAQALKSATYPQQEFPPELREEASSALKSEESYGPPGTSNETHADIKEGKGSPPSSAAAPQESSAGKPSGAGSTGQPEVAPAEKALPSASTAGLEHQLEIEAEQKCWVKVVIDGTQTQEVTLEPGDKRAWSVREKLEIVLGNSSGVQLKWDGHPVKFTHPKGRVARLQLPDEKLINGPKTP